MLLMPFVRLLAIYALIGAAIYGFFNRDQLLAYFEVPKAAIVEIPAPIVYSAVPVSAPTATPQAPAEVTAANAPPAFGAEISRQYFGQSASHASASARRARPNMVARWQNARELYSQGNSTGAAEIYNALAADYPNSADIHGETGNLYYNLGQFSKAATHYYEVGAISARKGDMQMAQYMWNLLQRISPAKAAELGALLNAGR